MKPIPRAPVSANVKQYGAQGDGKADDTIALYAALAATAEEGGVVYFPPGRWGWV
jgi:polygalacturonase